MPLSGLVVIAGVAVALGALTFGALLQQPSQEVASISEIAVLDESVHTEPMIYSEVVLLPLVDVAPPPVPEAVIAEPSKGLQVQSYTVRPGDTVHGLAERYGISAETIVWANDLADADILSIGDTLELPPVTGVLHRVRPGDTVAELVSFYGSAIRDVLDVNRLGPPFVIVVGQPLMIPGGKVPPPVSPGPGVAAEELPALPIPPAATEDQRTFILGHARAAQRSQQATGIPASVTLAQAILETYWGTSRLSREAHNYFGIKAREEPGPAGVITFNVWEHVNGRDIYSNEPFRRYNNSEESFVDHGKWFHTWPRYANALAVRSDAKAFARAINAAGYATDPAYSAKLISLMDKFNLYAYDAG
ncbi:MAG: glucosaminidase domain-containing protein [Chloroflexota bacterium]